MSISKSKDDLLLKHITELGIQEENSGDLINLIHILLKTNDKEQLTKELKEIYEENIDVDSFAEWVWNLYNEQDQQTHEETKSEYSENDNKAQATLTSKQQIQQTPKNIPTEKNTDSTSAGTKKSRPAIYDEYERMQKVENVRNIHEKAKNLEQQKNKTKNHQNQQHQKTNQNNQYNQQQPNNLFNLTGKRPLPPAPPKENKTETTTPSSKPSILDRIVKKGDDKKKTLETKLITQSKPNIVLHTSKHEKIEKKVKPNPEIKPATPSIVQKTIPEKQKKTPPAPIQKQETKHQVMSIEESNQDQGDNVQQGAGTQKKVRCRNWPACKNEACPYHHPTENCKHFPACPFGNKCLYIHPAINCKFGAFCQRPNCAYVHPRNNQMYYGFGGPAKKPYKGHPANAGANHQQGDNNNGHPQVGDDFENQHNQGEAEQF